MEMSRVKSPTSVIGAFVSKFCPKSRGQDRKRSKSLKLTQFQPDSKPMEPSFQTSSWENGKTSRFFGRDISYITNCRFLKLIKKSKNAISRLLFKIWHEFIFANFVPAKMISKISFVQNHPVRGLLIQNVTKFIK